MEECLGYALLYHSRGSEAIGSYLLRQNRNLDAAYCPICGADPANGDINRGGRNTAPYLGAKVGTMKCRRGCDSLCNGSDRIQAHK